MRCGNVAVLLNESRLVDFFHGAYSRANLGQPAIAQSDHAFFASNALDLRSRATIHDHFANAVGQIEQFTNRRAAMIAGAGTFQATSALGKNDVFPYGRVEARFL